MQANGNTLSASKRGESKMKFLMIAIGALLVTAAAVPKRQYRDGVLLSPAVLTAAEKNQLAGQVKDILKDPESARFTWAVARPNTDVYCFTVNAKNSYGGYTGHVLGSAAMVVTEAGYIFLADPQLSEVGAGLDVNSVRCRSAGYLPSGGRQ
jgi:hypothetical protein